MRCSRVFSGGRHPDGESAGERETGRGGETGLVVVVVVVRGIQVFVHYPQCVATLQ